ncbi:MAG: Gfo/Idh/MocA family oxidoreductase [Elusimicrobia bacterium]|nr:Gfo/Idh/MocA family oxidoreductase [Elusimicrobiota bacterium]
MKNRLKGALAGFGQVAQRAHAPAFASSEHFSIVAVAEENPARLEAAKAFFPRVRLYSSLEVLLRSESELDFISIATPPFLHAPQTLAALERGCHVLCEKPLALSREELDAMEELARARGRVVFTVHNWAHAAQWKKALDLIQAGTLGEIRHAELHVLRQKPASSALADWRRDRSLAGGGILLDHGWHNLYLIYRLLGCPEARPKVSARFWRESPSHVEDEATVLLDFLASSALLHLSWRSFARTNWAVVYGTRGRLELADNELRLELSSGHCETFQFQEKLSQLSAHPSWMASLIEEFHSELLQPGPRRNLAEARFCLSAIEEAYRQSPEPCPAGAPA